MICKDFKDHHDWLKSYKKDHHDWLKSYKILMVGTNKVSNLTNRLLVEWLQVGPEPPFHFGMIFVYQYNLYLYNISL